MMESVKHISIRLATPEAVGSGFYLVNQDIIVTLEHIIRGCKEVVVEGLEIPRQLAEVVYTDQMLDLAFLKIANSVAMNPPVLLLNPKEGQEVVAFASTFTIGEVSESGMIDFEDFLYHGQSHIMHDALLDNAANGGVLCSTKGELLGLNSFIHWKGRDVGMALPIETILKCYDAYKAQRQKYVTKCPHCHEFVGGDQIDNCSQCGNYLDMPNASESYTAEGVALTIEHLLSSMGYTLELSRIGHNHWQLERGSASINITYFEKNGLIIGDAYMCKLPDQSNVELLKYLLRQNHEMENLTFSVKEQDIILSLLIYDRYLNEQTGTELLTNLLEKADYFDNILVNDYQCLWLSSRKLR